MANRTVTQNDVAKEAGVTRSMVSYVISGNAERSVAPETRKRILDAIEKLGYRPNKAAQALQQGDVAFAAKKIGVILPSAEIFKRPYYSEIIAGIYSAAHENNYHVSFIRFFDELKDSVLFNELIHAEEIGSLILLALDQCIEDEKDMEIISRINERIEKIVCVEWKCEGLSSVLFDRQETARKATEYMFRCGHEKEICYLGPEDDRVQGVQQILMLHNMNAKLEDFYIGNAFDMKGAYETIKSIHSTRTIPSAIVCGSDEVAVGVLRYLNESGIKVPEETAVVSIDNIEMSEFTNPPLTTMNVQKFAMGQQSVQMIVNNTATKGDLALSIMLPANIVVRKSC